jgi:nucleoside-diphosphate-sugar epimerase
MRYFLTGATGFLGGHLAKRLREAQHDVVALVRDPNRAKSLEEIGVELHVGDITDRQSLQKPMTGVAGVFHSAAWYKLGVREPKVAHQVNVEGTRNVLETMRDLKIPRGVYTSTLAVYSDTHGKMVDEAYHYNGPHISLYDQTKWRAHFEVADPLIAAGLPLTIVLPGVIYGHGDHSPVKDLFLQMVRGETCNLPRGTEYCWSHVDDVVTAHLLAMEMGTPGESYIIAGPRHSLLDVANIASQVLGRKVKVREISPSLIRALAAIMQPIGAILPIAASMQPESLRAIAGVTYLGANAKAVRELGYAPRPLREGLSNLLPQLSAKNSK